MSELVNIPISTSVFARLQRLAVPLIDDTNSVIERLIGHWESNPPIEHSIVTSPSKSAADMWRSPRGDVLPVGAALQGEYLGKMFHACVEKQGIRFDGSIYDSPSAAGVAAKGQLGRQGRAASTDGRKFWKIQDVATGRWLPIGMLRPRQRIDSDSLLAELAES